MICSTCDAPVAVDSLKIWNSRTVCTDCFGVLSGQATPSQPNLENPRTIRETTVCPACQAEFHKDHPTCPECNTVLDPAFRVARQTKRAVQEVSELVVENTRTTRQIFVYVLRLLIAGFLWALVVLSAFSLIVGLLSQKATINWWGVPVSAMWFVTVIWLARRIGPGHFRPRPRLNNESASKSSAGSQKVSQTDRSVPKTAIRLHDSKSPLVVFAFVLPIGMITWILVIASMSDGSSKESAVREMEKNSSVTFERDKSLIASAPEQRSSKGLFKDVQEKTVVLVDYTNKLERVAKEVINVHGEQLTFEIPDGFGRLDSEATEFIREYRKTVPPLVELLSLYIEDSDKARLRQGMQPLARRDISIRTLARPPITHYTQKQFDLVANAIRTAGPKAVLDAGLRLNREMGAEDLTSRAAQGIQEEVTQLETIRYQNDCLITICMVKVEQTQDKAASITWHAGAFAFCLRKGKIMEIRVMSRSSHRSQADLEWVTTMAKRCVHQLN
jgi:hypothetical protein